MVFSELFYGLKRALDFLFVKPLSKFLAGWSLGKAFDILI